LELSKQPSAAAVAAATAVVKEFYLAALAPQDANGKGPALAYLPEALSKMLKKASPKTLPGAKGDRVCLKHIQNFSQMFDSKGLRTDRLLCPPKVSKEQSKAMDELLVELLRAGQALDNILAAAENGPTLGGHASSCKSHRDEGGVKGWLDLLADCLVKEANKVYRRLHNSMSRPSASVGRQQQEEKDLPQLAAAVCRLQKLTNQLAAVDPEAAEQARDTLRRDTSLWTAAGSAAGPSLLESLAKFRQTGQTCALDFLCRHVLLGVRVDTLPGEGARSLGAEHDEYLVMCLRASVMQAGADDVKDIGAVCLVWWAAEELAAEVSCCTRKVHSSAVGYSRCSRVSTTWARLIFLTGQISCCTPS
jgi:hypothetical protein